MQVCNELEAAGTQLSVSTFWVVLHHHELRSCETGAFQVKADVPDHKDKVCLVKTSCCQMKQIDHSNRKKNIEVGGKPESQKVKVTLAGRDPRGHE